MSRAAKIQSKKKGQSGQILVLMAMMSTTLIVFFGMVVSIGHLIQARINLQNAVDLAAMVGASHQARYLNSISIVNYRMRQNYKFVLSDMYVTQSRFNRGWQNAIRGSNTGKINLRGETVGICQQAPGYYPATAIERATGGRAFPTTNFCQHVLTGHAGIPHIQWTPVPSANPIVQAINAGNLALKLDFESTCDEARDLNHAYFKYLIGTLETRNRVQMELLANVLQEFKAAFPHNSDVEDVTGNGGIADAAVYQTFRKNLIGANATPFDSTGSIEYINPLKSRTFAYNGDVNQLVQQALTPGGSSGNFREYFESQTTSFTINVALFENSGGACRACIVQAKWQGLNASPPSCAGGGGGGGPSREVFLGLSRAREAGGDFQGASFVSIPFNIVLRARVRPNLLFWPRSLTPFITAVGAAKPFGSRIGPPIEASNLELTGDRRGFTGGSVLANISFFPGDDPSGAGNNNYGYAHRFILKTLLSLLPAGATDTADPKVRPHVGNSIAGGGGRCTGSQPSFVNMSLAPTLYEGLMWSIFPFPVTRYGRGPADVAAFPYVANLGFIPNVQNQQNYYMEDRMTNVNIGDRLEAWHHVNPSLGAVNQQFGEFYSDCVSSASAFNSDIMPDEVQGFIDSGQLTGRTGYQVKLASIPQICAEINGSSSVAPAGILAEYCQTGGPLQLRY